MCAAGRENGRRIRTFGSLRLAHMPGAARFWRREEIVAPWGAIVPERG
jgi:hypothetical protein